MTIHDTGRETIAGLMTLRDAAAMLGLSPETLRKQAQRGTLTAVKRGRDWYVSADEVERYRAEHRGRNSGGRPAKQEQLS